MLVQYCSSWSYGAAFEQLKKQMSYIHSEVVVIGENYPLPPIRQFLSTIISFLQIGLVIGGIGGRFIPAINNHPFYQKIQ